MATIGRTHYNIVCDCGNHLTVETANINDFTCGVDILVTGHKCISCEKDLKAKIAMLESKVRMYETKIQNFKEFANIMKGK